jgi:hypothetical protein
VPHRKRIRRTTYFKSGDRVPLRTPRRYPDTRGYVRLRWTVEPNHEVEVWEHRVRDGVVVDDEHVHHDNHVHGDNHPANLVGLTKAEHMALHGVERREDWPKIVDLYQWGMTTRQIAELMARNTGNVSRILRKSGVSMRTVADRYPLPARQDVEQFHAVCGSAAQLADALDCSVSTARRALRVYELPSYLAGRPAKESSDERRLEGL